MNLGRFVHDILYSITDLSIFLFLTVLLSLKPHIQVFE